MKHNNSSQIPRILLCESSGMPLQWSTWENVVIAKCKGLVLWELGDHEFIIRGGRSRLSGTQSIITIPSIVSIKRSGTKHARQFTNIKITGRNLFSRDGYICGYCGNRFTTLTMDHIVPTSRNGAHTWENLVSACQTCNSLKGDKLLSETNMCLLHNTYKPSFLEFLCIRNPNMMADQYEYIKCFLKETEIDRIESRMHSDKKVSLSC